MTRSSETKGLRRPNDIRSPHTPRQPLGRILLRQKLVSAEELNDLIKRGRKLGSRLASTAAARGTIADNQLLRALSEQHGVPGIDLSQIVIALSNLALVPKELAQQHKILPIVIQTDRIHLAMADPLNHKVIEEIEFITGRKVVRYIALHDALLNVIEHAYQMHKQNKPYYLGPFVPPAHLKNLETHADMPIQEAIVNSHRDTPLIPASHLSQISGACFLDSIEDHRLTYSAIKCFRSVDAFVAYVASLQRGVALVDLGGSSAEGLRICSMFKHYQDPKRVRLVVISDSVINWDLAADLKSMGVSLSLVVQANDNILQKLFDALESDPIEALSRETIQAAIDESRAAFDAGHIQKAIGILTRAIGSNEPTFELHVNLGLLYGYSQQTFDAIRELEAAKKMVRDDYTVLKNLAILYGQVGFARVSANHWLAALQTAPDADSAQSVRKHIVNLLTSDTQS